MKKLILPLLFTAACNGSSDSGSTAPIPAEWQEQIESTSNYYSLKDELPTCTDEKEGFLSYVDEESKFYRCGQEDDSWEWIAINFESDETPTTEGNPIPMVTDVSCLFNLSDQVNTGSGLGDESFSEYGVFNYSIQGNKAFYFVTVNASNLVDLSPYHGSILWDSASNGGYIGLINWVSNGAKIYSVKTVDQSGTIFIELAVSSGATEEKFFIPVSDHCTSYI